MKRGFTLIELLAVIVILAIIALIATPIVLNIINETKESATLRSAEFYMDAVENRIAMEMLKGETLDGPYNITKYGDLCKETLTAEKTCPDDKGIKIEVKGEKPSSGSIKIENGTIKDVEINIDSNEKTIVKNEKGELVYQTSICTLVKDNGEEGITPGDEYSCKVDPNKEAYTFYVLSDGENGTTNLIMDRNICEDGTLTKEGKTCLVEWFANAYDNSYGPVDAMTYLYNATKTWTNVPPLNYEYKDKEWQSSKDITFVEGSGYTSFTSVNGEGKINGTKFTETEPLRARMPIYTFNDDTEYGEVTGYNGTNTYLYNYMDEGGGITSGETAIYIIYGYWTLSSYAGNSYYAWRVNYNGYVDDGYVDGNEGYYGVRPVINLKL